MELNSQEEKTIFEFAKENEDLSTKLTNKLRLQTLESYRLKIGGKTRRSGTGTAFSIGTNTWLTARHVINDCKQVFIIERGEKTLIKKILIHPNSDLAMFKFSSDQTSKFFAISNKIPLFSFGAGFPGGNPGDVALSFLSYMAMEERRYNIFEKHTILAVKERNPSTLSSFGGISGGPSFDQNSKITGVIVAEFVRRGILAAVGLNQIQWLIEAEKRDKYFPLLDQNYSEVELKQNVDIHNFKNVGQSFRSIGTIRQLLCLV